MIFKKHKQENKVNKKNGGFIPTPTFAKHHECVMESHCKSRCGGFTLVEAMTAIFILTFAIVGLMTMVSSSLFAARYARDDITVNYLLQESIDYIRNDRDTTVFLTSGAGTTDSSWATFSNKYIECTDERGCWINVLEDTFGQCEVSGCPYLYYDEDATKTAFYITDDDSGMTGMKKTNYKRKISVVRDVVNPDQILVTATIDWKNGNLNKSRSLTTSLTRWQK